MNEIMYDLPTLQIAAALFVSMVVAVECGYRIGRRLQRSASDPCKSHIGAIQGSLLGILGLILGFTFSLSLGRYDGRSVAVIDETNAIGTAWLRTQLLPDPAARNAIRTAMRDYVSLRVESANVDLAHHTDRAALRKRTGEQVTTLWTLARQAAAADPNPVTTGLYVQSLNDMIDARDAREAALDRHVPEVVLFLLYGTFLLTGCVVGYTAGLSGHRASLATYILIVLIVLLVFVIVDLDRPRRGLIRVNHQSLVDLQTSVKAENDEIK